MSGFIVRPAQADDAPGLCAVLNSIIRAGGTTALQEPLSVAQFGDWFISGPYVRACQVAVAGAARLGFQVINATIRADTAPGLAYCARMGFRDYRVDAAVPLDDGRPVDRINRRFDPAADCPWSGPD